VQEPNLLQFRAWRDEVKLDIEYLGKHKLETRQISNGFEFDLILNSKPPSNEFVFQLDVRNLIFIQQPMTVPEYCSAPDNALGSIAIYHKTKCHNYRNRKGFEYNYLCGKFGHIYRPCVYDDSDRKIWAEIIVLNGQLVITIDEQFLKDARYPVRIDPIIGYDVAGTWVYYPNCYILNDYSVVDINCAAPGSVLVNQVIESISAYTWTSNNPGWPNDVDSFKAGLYTKGTDPNGLDYAYVVATDPFAYPTYNNPQWHTLPLSGNLDAGINYVTAFQSYSENCGFVQARIRWAFDVKPPEAASARWDYANPHASFNWPDPLNWGNHTYTSYMYSLYITYTDPPSPSPSPSPELEWDSTGNLLAPVNAAVHLNTNYAMLYSGTHEPKYVLDNNPNTYWRPSSTSNHSLYFKFDEPQIVDAFAFWIHNYNEGFGGSKRWSLMCSMDGFEYRTYESVLFIDSRRAGVPLVVLKFDVPRIAKYWIFNLEGFGDPVEGPEDMPIGPIMEISGLWFLRDYSLPYDNQYPEPIRFEWGNDLALARSGSGYQERRFRGHVKVSDKEYVFVQQDHSDLLLNAFKTSKGGLLPIAFKPDYDSIDWILCRFTSDHSLQETWSEVFQPKMEVREVGFKRVAYTTKTLPMLSTTVGHWKFGESLADSSSNGQTLSVVDVPGGAIYDYGICDHNKTCIVLEEDGLLEVSAVDADALDMGTTNFSLELIFATTPVSETTYLLRKIGDNPSPASSPEPSPSPVAAGYSVSLTTAGKINVTIGDGSTEVEGTGYGTDLDDGSFHYLSVTVDRTLDLLKVYVDGMQTGSSLDISSIIGSITNAVEPFQIGGENLLSDPKCLIGLLDEVCVSKQLLTPALIASRHVGFSHDGSWRL
jgi:hypothetical protein